MSLLERVAPYVRGRADVLRKANQEKEEFSTRAAEFSQILGSSVITSETSAVQVKEWLRRLQDLQTEFIALINGNLSIIVAHGLKEDAMYLIQTIDVCHYCGIC